MINNNFKSLFWTLPICSAALFVSTMFATCQYSRNMSADEELNRLRKIIKEAKINYNKEEFLHIKDDVNDLQRRLHNEYVVRDNLVQDFHELGFHDINVENGLINLTDEQIVRLREENNNWIIIRVEQLNNSIHNVNLELLTFMRDHNGIIQELVRGNFFNNNEVGDNHCFRLALNNRLIQMNGNYNFGISMFEDCFVQTGWRYNYSDLVVERPENFRDGSILYRELEQIFLWHSDVGSRNTFAQFLASTWEHGDHVRYYEISDGARRTLASIVRVMRDNNALTREQRDHILAISRIHISEHGDLCKNRAESIILAIAAAIDYALQGETARNIDNIEQMNKVILSLWRQSIVSEGINCLPGMEDRDGDWVEENRISHMRRLSLALNVPWNGHEENYRPISYDTAANLLLQNDVISLKSICDSARVTFLGANKQGLMNMDAVMSDIPIDFQTFEKCVLTYDKYNVNELLATAEQYAEQKAKSEILEEVMNRRGVPLNEQNNRAERIRIAVENVIIDSLMNFQEDIQGLNNVVEKNDQINRIAEQISMFIQRAIPEKNLENLGFGIVNKAINTAKDNTFRNIDVNDNQMAVVNIAIKKLIKLQNRRGAALQKENRRFEREYRYDLLEEVNRVNNAKLEIHDLVTNPDATIRTRIQKYLNRYLRNNDNARENIQNWVDGRMNLSMRQVSELLPNIDVNKYLVPELVPSDNPNIYRANILYPIYLVHIDALVPIN